jgi:hypothetical protein
VESSSPGSYYEPGLKGALVSVVRSDYATETKGPHEPGLKPHFPLVCSTPKSILLGRATGVGLGSLNRSRD